MKLDGFIAYLTYFIIFIISITLIRICLMGGKGKRYKDNNQGISLITICITSIIILALCVVFFRSPFLINLCKDLPFFGVALTIIDGFNNFDLSMVIDLFSIKHVNVFEESFKTILFLGTFLGIKIIVDKVFGDISNIIVKTLIIDMWGALFSATLANILIISFNGIYNGDSSTLIDKILIVVGEIGMVAAIIFLFFVFLPAKKLVPWLVANLVSGIAKLIGTYILIIDLYIICNNETFVESIGCIVIAALAVGAMIASCFLSLLFGDINYK